MADSFYKNEKISNIDISNTYIQIDSDIFRKPYIISVETIGNLLQLKINNNLIKDLSSKNVTSINYMGQDNNKDISPITGSPIEKTYISVDENYMYIWIDSLQKWKRILLSDW